MDTTIGSTSKAAGEIVVGDVVKVSTAYARYVGRPELAGALLAVAKVVDHDTTVGIVLEGVDREVNAFPESMIPMACDELSFPSEGDYCGHCGSVVDRALAACGTCGEHVGQACGRCGDDDCMNLR